MSSADGPISPDRRHAEPPAVELFAFTGSNHLQALLFEWMADPRRQQHPESQSITAWCVGELAARADVGDSCLGIDEIPRRFGDNASLEELLLRSPWCSDGSRVTPLVFQGKTLSFYRTWRMECDLAERIAERVKHPLPIDPATAGILVREDFPLSGSKVDWQAIAVASALRNRFTMVAGGPATGKTFILSRLIKALRVLHPDLTLALAAPTATAAKRMFESLCAANVRDLPVAQTLHALLGFDGGRAAFTRSERNLLPHDLVIVDEASGADTEVLHALFGAIRPDARIVIVGDRDQLPRMGQTQVFADLCTMARPERGVGKSLASWCRSAGMVVEGRSGDDGSDGLADSVIMLRTTRRFAPSSGLGGAVNAISERKAGLALELLLGEFHDLHCLKSALLDNHLHRLRTRFNECLGAGDPNGSFAAHSALRVLCAQTDGQHSVADLNNRIEDMLCVRGKWYHGRPIILKKGDGRFGLKKGDFGICWSDEGALKVLFRSDLGGHRSLAPHLIPEHRTAWATTVHDAMDTDADEVLLVLPPQVEGWAPVLLQAPLLYTALTRARQRATIVADTPVLERALTTWPTRKSGFADALSSALAR